MFHQAGRSKSHESTWKLVQDKQGHSNGPGRGGGGIHFIMCYC